MHPPSLSLRGGGAGGGGGGYNLKPYGGPKISSY